MKATVVWDEQKKRHTAISYSSAAGIDADVAEALGFGLRPYSPESDLDLTGQHKEREEESE